MDREADLQELANLVDPVLNSVSTSSSSSPDFLRNVRAAFKRHRPLGKLQSNNILPKRMLVPRRAASRSSAADAGSVLDSNDSCTPPIAGTITKACYENINAFNVQSDCPNAGIGCKEGVRMPLLEVESHHADAKKKVHFSVENNAAAQGADDQMATGMENLSSYMDSLALTEMELHVINKVEASTIVNHDPKHQNFQNMETDITLKSDGGISSSLAKRITIGQEQFNQFRNFFSHPVTQSSVVGSSCPTSTSIHSSSAPLLNPTTFSFSQQDEGVHEAAETLADSNLNLQHVRQGDMSQLSYTTIKNASGKLADHRVTAVQASTSVVDIEKEVIKYDTCKEQRGNVSKESGIPNGPSPIDDQSTKGKGFAGDVTDIQSQAPLSNYSSSDVRLEPSKLVKQEKTVSGKGASVHRKRNYDPDLFFKVNGKLYQRLGKIGSGGSSEVHKVISSDCTIYALKKIKLRGRDYATAYGFCQEIEYLNRLKGKNNIIQLIDYEVTDKTLLHEVMSGSMSNKDGRVKDDGYIYMVLEYGEIDLAHMLSYKWKEIDNSNQTIDENWLRFYWQQILQAVNTIHEERIVHSDLKPANFLLVKGSLKLIDFGIAKAIMSDTTNIQRDSQVGTLSYMSPEAFMCNENDANGNTIKCGRPSDIWSLGCILYQMVYGRTPFSDYKTFWTKFKVITDPSHKITYEPVSNQWLLDLMTKCLAWDRNERWRIPQLLHHPFLVPPVPSQVPLSQNQSCNLLQLITNACANDAEASNLCLQLNRLLTDPFPPTTFQSLKLRDQQCNSLSQISNICLQLRNRLANSGRE